MISIIVCSASSVLFNQLEISIAATIAQPYEIICIENSKSAYSISEAYNQGAAKAKYPYLCFMHEDVEIRSSNWGAKAMAHINAGNILIGVAGSSYKSQVISGWSTGSDEMDFCNIYHKNLGGNLSHYFHNKSGNPVARCTVIDGVWLFCKKEAWQEVRFNEKLLKGFHFYDLDFSMRCSEVGDVAVVFDIDLIHYSSGKFGKEWLDNATRFHRFYKKQLPKTNITLSSEKKSQLDKQVALFWLKRMRSENLPVISNLLFLIHLGKSIPRQALKEVVSIFFQ